MKKTTRIVSFMPSIIMLAAMTVLPQGAAIGVASLPVNAFLR